MGNPEFPWLSCMPFSGGTGEVGAIRPRGTSFWKIGLAFAKALKEESRFTLMTSQHPIPCACRQEGMPQMQALGGHRDIGETGTTNQAECPIYCFREHTWQLVLS